LKSKAYLLIEEVVVANGYELIEAEFFRAKELWRVFVDHHDSARGKDLITVEDCAVVSNAVADALTDAMQPYEHLEVSSPGMDRALTKPDHFDRFAGEIVKLTLDPALAGERKIVGELKGFSGEAVDIVVDGKQLSVPYATVTRARVVPQF
jgi:ribosome maturation factor RimP